MDTLELFIENFKKLSMHIYKNPKYERIEITKLISNIHNEFKILKATQIDLNELLSIYYLLLDNYYNFEKDMLIDQLLQLYPGMTLDIAENIIVDTKLPKNILIMIGSEDQYNIANSTHMRLVFVKKCILEINNVMKLKI